MDEFPSTDNALADGENKPPSHELNLSQRIVPSIYIPTREQGQRFTQGDRIEIGWTQSFFLTKLFPSLNMSTSSYKKALIL